MSPEEYLEGEKYSDVKHEYVGGQVYAMVGASRPHNAITVNLSSALHAHLRGAPCQVYVADMKVRVADIFYYPDVVVDCAGLNQPLYYSDQPVLIVEVLSPSTEARDNLEKRIAYQSLPSLKEYVLIAQNKIEVQIYRRVDPDWEVEVCSEGDRVALTSVDLKIPIETIFEGLR